MNKTNLHVVVARFQVPALHKGHRHLLDTAWRDGDLLVVLGSPAGLPDARNPLAYETRKAMVLGSYPDVGVAEIVDCPSDRIWSERLDNLIEQHTQGRAVQLFASRNSFAEVYSGDYQVVTIPQLREWNGTDTRDALQHVDSEAFRAGVIVTQRDRLPVSYQTVDIAVIKHDSNEVLLGQKQHDEGKYRMVGGFVDPTDQSLEGSAARELREEVGPVDTHELRYLGSYRIDDHRYRNSNDGVMTAFFATYHLGGAPRASDDLDRVEWIPLDRIHDVIVPQHKQLAQRLVAYVTTFK